MADTTTPDNAIDSDAPHTERTPVMAGITDPARQLDHAAHQPLVERIVQRASAQGLQIHQHLDDHAVCVTPGAVAEGSGTWHPQLMVSLHDPGSGAFLHFWADSEGDADELLRVWAAMSDTPLEESLSVVDDAEDVLSIDETGRADPDSAPPTVVLPGAPGYPSELRRAVGTYHEVNGRLPDHLLDRLDAQAVMPRHQAPATALARLEACCTSDNQSAVADAPSVA